MIFLDGKVSSNDSYYSFKSKCSKIIKLQEIKTNKIVNSKPRIYTYKKKTLSK